MVDTLAFLDSKYTEEEAKKICQEMEPLCELIGAYYTDLVRTTRDLTLEYIKEECTRAQRDALSEKFVKEYGDNWYEKYHQHLWEIGMIGTFVIEKGRYALISCLNLTAYREFARILNRKNISFDAMEHWWNDSFAKEDFEDIPVESIEVSVKNPGFVLEGSFDKDSLNALRWNLRDQLKEIGLGLGDTGDIYLAPKSIKLANGSTIDENQSVFFFTVLESEYDEFLNMLAENNIRYSAIIENREECPFSELTFVSAFG